MRRAAWAIVGAVLLAQAGFAQAQAQEPAPDQDGEAAPAQTEPTPEGSPPPDYYTEPPEPPAEPRQAAQPEPAPSSSAAPAPRPKPARPPAAVVHEPPPPGVAYYPVYEPPPPPEPRHVAPKTALWLGARVGWFVPFGAGWAECVARDAYGYCLYDSIPLRDYVSSGPLLELDLGMRLGRRYNLLFTWEHAELGGGSNQPDRVPTTPPSELASSGGDTDFYALGLRFSSDPDRVGFLTEFALGYRRLRAKWDDGTELRLTDGLFEFRLGLGADIRLSPSFTLSPLATIGFGSFGDGEWVDSNGAGENVWVDARDAHGWLTLQLGGHFDIGG
jgi:hypothetical protein